MTNPTDRELEPCPFCGGEAASFFHRIGERGESWHVECQADDCGCGTCHHDSEAEAIAAWNRRPTPQAGDELARELLREARDVVSEAAIAAEQEYETKGRADLNQRADDLFVLREQIDTALSTTPTMSAEDMREAAAKAFCNKCGFFGQPDDEWGNHKRPKTGEPCPYLAPLTKEPSQ